MAKFSLSPLADDKTAAKNAASSALAQYETQKLVDHALNLNDLGELSKADKLDHRVVENRCKTYLQICADDGVTPSVVGLAVALHVPRRDLVNPKRDTWSAEVAAVISHYVNMIDLTLTTLTLEGKINYSYATFLQKNNSGYSDKTEIALDKPDTILTRDDLVKRADAISSAPLETSFTVKPSPRAKK